VTAADVERLEAERLHPSPKEEHPTERLIRELIHVLACAMGCGRTLT